MKSIWMSPNNFVMHNNFIILLLLRPMLFAAALAQIYKYLKDKFVSLHSISVWKIYAFNGFVSYKCFFSSISIIKRICKIKWQNKNEKRRHSTERLAVSHSPMHTTSICINDALTGYIVRWILASFILKKKETEK